MRNWCIWHVGFVLLPWQFLLPIYKFCTDSKHRVLRIWKLYSHEATAGRLWFLLLKRRVWLIFGVATGAISLRRGVEQGGLQAKGCGCERKDMQESKWIVSGDLTDKSGTQRTACTHTDRRCLVAMLSVIPYGWWAVAHTLHQLPGWLLQRMGRELRHQQS